MGILQHLIDARQLRPSHCGKHSAVEPISCEPFKHLIIGGKYGHAARIFDKLPALVGKLAAFHQVRNRFTAHFKRKADNLCAFRDKNTLFGF